MNDAIDSLSMYMDYVEKLPNEFILSRGQSKDYDLLPSALRKDNSNNRKYTRQSVNYFLNEFKVNSHSYMTNPWDIKSNYEWMIYAQHYGLPTRLLDFTYSHIISLMFAVESAFSKEDLDDAVIWFLNPIGLNNIHANRSEIITLSGRQDEGLDDKGGPVVIQGRKMNSRINAQNGVFVYFQDSALPLNRMNIEENIIRKIRIKGSAKKGILSSLYAMGIGYTQIYPELTSVAKDIIMKNNIKFYMEEGEHLDE